LLGAKQRGAKRNVRWIGDAQVVGRVLHARIHTTIHCIRKSEKSNNNVERCADTSTTCARLEACNWSPLPLRHCVDHQLNFRHRSNDHARTLTTNVPQGPIIQTPLSIGNEPSSGDDPCWARLHARPVSSSLADIRLFFPPNTTSFLHPTIETSIVFYY
jgi:hypothetical protein